MYFYLINSWLKFYKYVLYCIYFSLHILLSLLLYFHLNQNKVKSWIVIESELISSSWLLLNIMIISVKTTIIKYYYGN